MFKEIDFELEKANTKNMTVYLIGSLGDWGYAGVGTYVLAATDRQIDLVDYNDFISRNGRAVGNVHDETRLDRYVTAKEPILLTDDYDPTDIMVLPTWTKSTCSICSQGQSAFRVISTNSRL